MRINYRHACARVVEISTLFNYHVTGVGCRDLYNTRACMPIVNPHIVP